MGEPIIAAAIPKVLIVDDQPRNLDVLEVMLADTGCALVRATSADEALLCLVRNEFAALVLDIRMPGMSGIELATLIKRRKRSEHVPILFLTAHSSNDDEAETDRASLRRTRLRTLAAAELPRAGLEHARPRRSVRR